MPHVADGDIHAYLDGALGVYPPEDAERIRFHLQSCADCSERLEAERGVRTRADQILARSGPESLEAPPFEELLHRARTVEAPAAHRRRSLSPGLAWAATLLLAMAVGWAGRGVLVPPDTRDLVSDEATAEAGRDATLPALENQASADVATPAAAFRERASNVPVAVTESEELPVAAASGREPADQVDEDRSSPRQAVDVSSILAEGTVSATPAAGEQSGAAARRANELSVGSLDVPAAPARALAESIEPKSDGVEIDELSREDGQARLGAAGFADAIEAKESSDLEARVSTLTTESGGRLTIPGLDVMSLGLAPPPSPQGAVLVVQRLGGGERVDLLHGTGPQPDGLSQSLNRSEQVGDSVEAERTGVQTVVVTWPGGWSVAIGPVSPDSLRALLRALR